MSSLAWRTSSAVLPCAVPWCARRGYCNPDRQPHCRRTQLDICVADIPVPAATFVLLRGQDIGRLGCPESGSECLITLICPFVAVWRDEWLPPSETFIRDQMRSMKRWSPLGVGLYPARFSEIAGWTATAGPWVARGLMKIGAGKVLIWRLRRHLAEREVGAIHAHFGTGAINALEVAVLCVCRYL